MGILDNNEVSGNRFLKGLKEETNYTLTENGAMAYKSTNSDLLDMFAVIGALRTRPSDEIVEKFTKAFAEDNLLAMKMLFYARNIRGGLGERKTFRTIITYMAEYHTEAMKKNMFLIPVFGRWDDLYSLFGTALEKDAIELIREQLSEDYKNAMLNKPISLLAKWLKNPEKVGRKSAALGKKTVELLGTNYKEYRKVLSFLRKKLNIVERNMSSNEWDKIVYEEVPSIAMKRYKDAFKKHNLIEFKEYIEKVQKGEAKINAGTLYPYDLMEAGGLGSPYNMRLTNWDAVIEEQWKALPNYIEGENNIMVMADTSGSMQGRPLASSVGLAVYFAERNSGAYKNKFMVFAGNPFYVELKGSNLKEKISCIPNKDESNTNIEKAFDLILETAIHNKLESKDLPKAIVIISDMEFDSASGRGYYNTSAPDKHNKLMDSIIAKYASHGYQVPKIVYWNVDSRQDTYHAINEQKNVTMVSGQSPSTFLSVIRGINEDAYEVMLKTLNDPMYDVVTV